MSIADLHTFTGVYATDSLDGEEHELFEQHLRTCEVCRSEVDELTATTARLAVAVSTPAPATLRDQVMAEVARTRQLPPLRVVTRLAERRAQRWYRQPASAAAALMLVTSVGLGAYALDQDQRAERAEQSAARIAAVATDPDRRERTVPASTGGTGTVVAADGTAIFRTTELFRLPDDQAYQLWVLHGEEKRSVGVLGSGGELEAIVDGLVATDALGLTVEPASGSAQPTGPLVLRVAIA